MHARPHKQSFFKQELIQLKIQKSSHFIAKPLAATPLDKVTLALQE